MLTSPRNLVRGIRTFAGLVVMAGVLLPSSPVSAQSARTPAAGKGRATGWVAPRTPDGQPDLQGVWTNATLTPLERPADLAAKEFLTPQESEEYQKRVLARWDRDNRE